MLLTNIIMNGKQVRKQMRKRTGKRKKPKFGCLNAPGTHQEHTRSAQRLTTERSKNFPETL